MATQKDDEDVTQALDSLAAMTLNDAAADAEDADQRKEIEGVVNEMVEKCISPITGDQLSVAESVDTPVSGLLREKDSDAEEESLASNKEEKNRIEANPSEDKATDEKVSTDDQIQEMMEAIGGKFDRKPRGPKIRTEKWGESVGIVDENGSVRRVVAVEELHNYLVFDTLPNNRSKLYIALINDRFPRFLDSTFDYNQRWRMRYNLFVDHVLEDESDESLVHVGEIHVYFDLIPRSNTPYYKNTTFFENPLRAEKSLNPKKYAEMLDFIENFRRPPNILKLKFPMRNYLFNNTNAIFDKFQERQQELVDEARSVNRKDIQRRRRAQENQLRNGQSQSIRGPSSRYDHYYDDNGPRGGPSRRRPRNVATTTRRPNFSQNYRNDSQMSEKQSSVRNKSYERVFRGSKRRSQSRPHTRHNPSNESADDVTFEDTLERQERSAKGRRVESREDNFQGGSHFGHNTRHRRNSGRGLDSSASRRFSDGTVAQFSSSSFDSPQVTPGYVPTGFGGPNMFGYDVMGHTRRQNH